MIKFIVVSFVIYLVVKLFSKFVYDISGHTQYIYGGMLIIKFELLAGLIVVGFARIYVGRYDWEELVSIPLFAITLAYECFREYYLFLRSKNTRLLDLENMTVRESSSTTGHMLPSKSQEKENGRKQIKNSNQMKLNELSDDCLEYLFKFLDPEAIVAVSETCKRLNWIAESQFKHFTFYDCIIYENVATATNVISKMGKYLRQLSVTFKVKSFDGMLYDYCSYSDAKAFFELLNDCAGESLTALSLAGRSISEVPISILKPILQQLESLSLYSPAPSKPITTIDLPALCPKLKSLKINGPIKFAPNANKVITNLEEIAFFPFYDIDDSIRDDFFIQFLRQNTQLKTLCIGAYLYLIANLLRNLDGLKIHFVHEALFPTFGNVNRLRNLHVESITVNERFPFFMQNFQQVIDNLNLERVKFFESGNGEPDIVIPVVRAAKNLELICIGLSHNVTPKLIRGIAEARNAGVTVEKAPLKICFHTNVSKKSIKMFRRVWTNVIQTLHDSEVRKFIFLENVSELGSKSRCRDKIHHQPNSPLDRIYYFIEQDRYALSVVLVFVLAVVIVIVILVATFLDF